MMNRNRYPHDWTERARAIKEQAGWRCERCQVQQYTVKVPSMDALIVVVDPEVDHPKMIHLHAAHLNHDPHHIDADLKCWCASCHAKHDYAHRQREQVVALEQLRHHLALVPRRALMRWYTAGNGKRRLAQA